MHMIACELKRNICYWSLSSESPESLSESESMSESEDAKGSISVVLNDVLPKTSAIMSSISACKSSLRMSVSSHVPRALLIPVTKNDLVMATHLHKISRQASAIQSTRIWREGGGILLNRHGSSLVYLAASSSSVLSNMYCC